MRLKGIKPEMAVHCKSDDEKKALLEEAERLGYVWYRTKNKPTERSVSGIGNTIHFYDEGTTIFSADYKHITHSCQTGDSVIEFSDLILPDLTNEEVLQICGEICEAYSNKGFNCKTTCPFGFHGMSCTVYRSQNFDKTIEICQRWKFDHKKNEPEIETVDICRIIEVLPDGERKCVHEEDLASGSTDAEIKILVEAELKRYCMEHEGEYIAVHEVVSRVKAVE